MSDALDTCLFDLDGTLIDSIELIYRSYEHAFGAHGLAVPDRRELRRGLGTPLAAQFELRTSDASQVEALIATYRRFNLAHHDALVRPYAGAGAAVRALRDAGFALGIVTSKRGDSARRGLASCGLGDLFDCVVALEDSTRHKPDPEPVLLALARLGRAPERAAYVGDSPHDMRAGIAAGVRVFAARWGPFEAEDFAGLRLDGAWDEPADIRRLLDATAAGQARVRA